MVEGKEPKITVGPLRCQGMNDYLNISNLFLYVSTSQLFVLEWSLAVIKSQNDQ